MKCNVHDLEAMSLNPGRVELGVLSTSVLVILEQKRKHEKGQITKNTFLSLYQLQFIYQNWVIQILHIHNSWTGL